VLTLWAESVNNISGSYKPKVESDAAALDACIKLEIMKIR